MSIRRTRRLGTALLISAYVSMNALLAIVLYTAPEWRRWIFGALLAGIIWAELKDRESRKPYLIRAMAIMTVAFIIWVIDFSRIACAPTSIVQGHAIWHILGALASWYLYLHYDHVTRIRK